ncbi:MAG: SLC13 family permease [Nitrospirota bacterium]
MNEKIIVLLIFAGCYSLALSRKVKLAYASLGASALLLASGILKIEDAVFNAIKWDVLGIYWGFMMVSFVFMKSRMPDFIAMKLLKLVRVEKYAILSLCALTAFLSAFMENVGVVLIMAPVAITIAKLLNSSLFRYMVAIAISSNVVTTVTMVADPPSIILALETGMKPLDFYWFNGRPGLGTLTIFGVIAAMLTLLFQFRNMNKKVEIETEKIYVTKGASALFVLGVPALAIAPELGIKVGIVGFAVGAIALYMRRQDIKEMLFEFDWDSFLFIVGIFMVIFSLSASGILMDFSGFLVKSGFKDPAFMLAFVTWVSVAASSFMDNVPYTILMIPVCRNLAEIIGMSAWPLLFGMLVGTGIGGNITPVGAAANVFACGILEKHGYKIVLKEYLKIGVPFSIAAVATVHILLQIFWLK